MPAWLTSKPFLFGAGGVVLAAVLLASIFSGGGGSGATQGGVQVESATRRTLIARVKASGEIAPEKKVEISAKVVGEILELPVVEGSLVKSGQVLVRIERDLAESARDQASSALKQAEVASKRLELEAAAARRNLDRIRELRVKEFASAEGLEQAETAVTSAEVALEGQRHAISQYRSALQKATDDLGRTTILSPMDGAVIALYRQKGETVVPGNMNQPGSVIMTLADLSHMVANVEVNEGDVVRIKPGQTADVTIDAIGGKAVKGHVAEIGASGQRDAGSGVIRFKVKVALDQPDPALRPAMTAKVSILASERADALAVPIQAVVKRKLDSDGREVKSDKPGAGAKTTGEEQSVVYVLENGKARMRAIETGISNDIHAEITDGLAENQLVIVGPYRVLKTLRDGDLVQRETPKQDKNNARDAATSSPAPSAPPNAAETDPPLPAGGGRGRASGQ